MDYKEPNTKRSKKSDKAKESYEKNGKFTQRYIRQKEKPTQSHQKK
jgi:hypothetical protein